MTNGPNAALFRDVHRLFEAGTVAGLTEDQLLARFVSGRDAAAFEALVARHGPMVFGVCRRVLRDPRDAEDAFQATFAILARRAESIRIGSPVATWLYGVARRVALRVRAENQRRGVRETTDQDRVASAPSRPPHPPEVRWILDEEIGRLPEKYRAPIVLCYVEGLTHEEASERLRWPVGTVRGRMARARDLLRSRLIRRGLAPSAAATGVSLGEAAVPVALQELAVQTALRFSTGRIVTAGMVSARVLSLSQGILKGMLLSKLKNVGLIAAAGFATIGVLYAYRDAGAGTKPADRRPVAEPGSGPRPASIPDSRGVGSSNDQPKSAPAGPVAREPASPAGTEGPSPTLPQVEPPSGPGPVSQAGSSASSAPVIGSPEGVEESQPPSRRNLGSKGSLPLVSTDVTNLPEPVRAEPSSDPLIPPPQKSDRVVSRDIKSLLERTRAEVDEAVRELASEEATLSKRLWQVRSELEQLRSLQNSMRRQPSPAGTFETEPMAEELPRAATRVVEPTRAAEPSSVEERHVPAEATPSNAPPRENKPIPTLPTNPGTHRMPYRPEPTADRLSNLERKLDGLLKAMELMKQELNTPRPPTGNIPPVASPIGPN